MRIAACAQLTRMVMRMMKTPDSTCCSGEAACRPPTAAVPTYATAAAAMTTSAISRARTYRAAGA